MTATTPSKEAQEQPRKKVYYADNLRSSLTALVVLHHAAMNFGGVGITGYYGHKAMSSIPLVGFNVLNQTFFMGSFMFLGGYFSKRTAQRKTTMQFIKDRLYRLGLPAVVYTAICAPLTMALHRVWTGQEVGLKWWVEYLKSVCGLKGVVWFIGLLLCFDLSLIAIKKTKEAIVRPSEESSTEASKERTKKMSTLILCASLAATSTTDFLLRTIWPVGTHVDPLGFQPAYLGHYLASYLLGVCVEDFGDAIPSPQTTLGLSAASIISTYIFAKTLIANKSVQPMLGGWNSSAATYAVANNLIGYLIGSSLLGGFKRYANRPWPKSVSEPAYSAFLVHMPILTAVTIGSVKWQADGIVKTVGVGGAAILASWGAGIVLDGVCKEVEGFWTANAKSNRS